MGNSVGLKPMRAFNTRFSGQRHVVSGAPVWR